MVGWSFFRANASFECVENSLTEMGEKMRASRIYISSHVDARVVVVETSRPPTRMAPKKAAAQKGLPAADTAEEEEEEEDDFDDDDDADLMHHRTEDDDDDDEELIVSAVKQWKTAMKPVVYLNAALSAIAIAFLAQETAFLSVPIGILGLLACATWAWSLNPSSSSSSSSSSKSEDVFKRGGGLGATTAATKKLALTCVVLDGTVATRLAIGTLFANGTMVTRMVTMATLFGAHGVGYWEMYARAKAIGKVHN